MHCLTAMLVQGSSLATVLAQGSTTDAGGVSVTTAERALTYCTFALNRSLPLRPEILCFPVA